VHVEPYRRMLVERALGLVRRQIARPLLHGLRRPMILRQIARVSETRLMGLRLRTEPGVFHPVYFSSSRILAEHIVARAPRGLSVLDMGTGSGAIAISAAAAGATVTACDVNPLAVALARTNANLNRLSVEVIESDLFAAPALEGRLFDLIVFNIPFYPHDPTTHLEHAFRAGRGYETVRRFAAGARPRLSSDGRVIIVFSEDCDRRETLGAFADAGLSLEYERVTNKAFELFSVACFRPG
jgi:release factor glutamine methyltransferase